MRLLDRYVLRNFFEPFFLCFFGFLAIWLIFDLSDNGPEFLSENASLKVVLQFYITQLPAIILIVLPVGLLLALLFSLSKMSRSNEIISMLGAGCSVMRVIVPLLVVGVLASGVLFALNYKLGPHAEGIKKAALTQIKKGKRDIEHPTLEGHLFRDRETLRTWYVRKMTAGEPTLIDVVIHQQDAQANITKTWYARRAIWDAKTSNWVLHRGMAKIFDLEGNEERRIDFTNGIAPMSGWRETPWRISSSSFEAQSLSVPELRDYLKYNDDFPQAQLAPYRTHLAQRFALPWNCFAVVLVAAPLGIVFNRRGVFGGVVGSIFVFFGLMFATNLCLALGKGDRMSPFAAAWTPNLIVAGIGLVLLYMRSTNRDLPKLTFKRARR
jgi:LPS export ABC transporter permease LptG